MLFLVIMSLNGEIVKNYEVPPTKSCQLVEKATNEGFKSQKASYKAECYRKDGEHFVKV